MWTPRPAARPAHAFLEFTAHARDVLASRLRFLHDRHPTDPLVAREGRDVLPCGKRFFVSRKGRAHIGGKRMQSAAGNSFFGHTSMICHYDEATIRTMRKIIVLTFLTLDGVLQGPGGPKEDTSGGFPHGGWTVPYFDEFSGKAMEEQMRTPFELLLGRVTYDIWASYWPQHEEGWPGVNAVKKYVASRTQKELTWQNSHLLQGDAAEAIRTLKEQDGPDLHVYGSGNLVQTLLNHDLVDAFWLKIFPITLGTGKKLFAEGTIPAAFKLTSSKVSPSGVIFANYERAGEVETGEF